MSNPLYQEQMGFNPNQFMQELNKIKSQGGNPNQIIQNMLNSGRISQAQLNAAAQRAQHIMQMLSSSVRR